MKAFSVSNGQKHSVCKNRLCIMSKGMTAFRLQGRDESVQCEQWTKAFSVQESTVYSEQWNDSVQHAG
jgi:hypothetical protein